jgi:hypothetical protein
MNSRWLKWQEGRQKSGYMKMLLLTSHVPLPFDVYLLKYEKDSFVLPHTDEVESGQHYRLNIILRKAKLGGDFVCQGAIVDKERIKLFRPDLDEHSVSKIESGARLVLSIGWIWGRAK